MHFVTESFILFTDRFQKSSGLDNVWCIILIVYPCGQSHEIKSIRYEHFVCNLLLWV